MLCQKLSPNSHKIEVTIKRYDKSIAHKARGYYFGVMIPAILEQLENDHGEKLTAGDVDLINRQHAYGGAFETKNILGKDVLEFKQVSLASMTKEEFSLFVNAIKGYWMERYEIEIPEPINEDVQKLKSALSPTGRGSNV